VVTPQESFSVAQYAARAHTVIDELRGLGTPVVVEGGSGLYLRAALGDLAFGARPSAETRREFEERWERDPAGVLDELRTFDDVAYARLDTANPRRVLRALETLRAQASPPPATEGLWHTAERYPHRLVALVPDAGRTALRGRIERRVDEMLAAGALEEVRRALVAGPLSATASQAIGIRELAACLAGELTLTEAAARMKARTRVLARRQLTWMRKLPAPALVPTVGRPPEAVAAEVLELLQARSW
jgi:tRNA dimethylallyltransferase